MEKDERRTLTAPYAPPAYKDASAWNFYERVQDFSSHHEPVLAPGGEAECGAWRLPAFTERSDVCQAAAQHSA